MDDTLNSRTAANIRAELARRRITQEEFAATLGIGRTAVTAMLNGQTAITLDKLELVAAALGMDPRDLLT